MIAWLLNLDAHGELFGAGAGAPGASRARALAALTDPGSPHSLMEPGDVVVAAEGPGIPEGTPAMPWCLTPGARRTLTGKGLRLAFTPSDAAVRRANDRATFTGRGDLPGVHVCPDIGAVERAVSRPAPARAPGSDRPPAWLLRAAHCGAGRRRLVTEVWDHGVETFARRQLVGGPVIIAPVVDIEAEFAVHGLLLEDGQLEIGAPMAQRVEGGAWRGSAVLPGQHPQRRHLQETALAVGQELCAMGFTGPFGVDAFQWRDSAGQLRLHAPSEVNARLTMGFPRSGLLPLMRAELRSGP